MAHCEEETGHDAGQEKKKGQCDALTMPKNDRALELSYTRMKLKNQPREVCLEKRKN